MVDGIRMPAIVKLWCIGTRETPACLGMHREIHKPAGNLPGTAVFANHCGRFEPVNAGERRRPLSERQGGTMEPGENAAEKLPKNHSRSTPHSLRPIHLQPAPHMTFFESHSLRPIHLTFPPSLRSMHPVSNQSAYSPAADPSAFHLLLHRRPPLPPLRPRLRLTPVLPA